MLKDNKIAFIFLPVFIFVALNSIFNLDINYYLRLEPPVLFQNNFYWTLLTYPLAEDSILHFSFFLIVLFVFYPLIRSLYNKWFFPIFFLLFVLLQGALVSLIFWNKEVVLNSFNSISIFILTISGLLYYKQKITFGKLPVVKISNLVILFLSIFLIMIVPEILNANEEKIQSTAIQTIYGFVIALILYLHHYIYKKYILPRKQMESLAEIQQLLIQARESVKALESSLIATPVELQEQTYTRNKPLPEKEIKLQKIIIPDDPEQQEQLLNTILDKIAEKGLESLNSQELEILKKLSKRI